MVVKKKTKAKAKAKPKAKAKTTAMNSFNNDFKKHSGCAGMTYFLGFIGAAVYYISAAPSFWAGVWGVIQAIIWPAFLVFELFKFMLV